MNSSSGLHYIRPIDIYDTFMAKEKKLSVNTILKIARKKGIILSSDTSRDELSRYISSIPFDNSDIAELYELIESDRRAEKTTSNRVKKQVTFDEIKAAVDKLNEERAPFDEVYTILTDPGASTCILDAVYYETDYSKARMLQTTKKKARIEFAPRGDTLVRFPANEKCTKIVDSILSNIESNSGEVLSVEHIELSHIADAEKRNNFFISLLGNVENMPAKDVVSVKMVPIADTDDFTSDEEEASSPELTGLIKRVAIDGKAITVLKEYQSLIQKGFFISSLTWIAEDKDVKPNVLVELEAGFANPNECKGFKYSVRGIYTLEKDSGMFSIQKKAAPEAARIKYLAVIEKAAKRSIDEISHDKS